MNGEYNQQRIAVDLQIVEINLLMGEFYLQISEFNISTMLGQIQYDLYLL